MSGCALMATAGFSIMTNGWASSRLEAELANAMPLKKPATPTPSGIHILMERDETRTINDRTGIDVRNE